MGAKSVNQFSPEVCQQLKYYIYRLIDPRTGETFYVGKGKNNRIFSHVYAEKSLENEPDYDELSPTLERIRAIRKTGLEVLHIVHRHGLDEKTALHVEAALIDAYPGVTNRVQGHDAAEFGARSTFQVIEKYQAPVAEFKHRCILISVNRSAAETDLYSAVRYSWKISPASAAKAELVLAVVGGLIRGVFVAEHWYPATRAHFPDFVPMPGRHGFVGRPAPREVAELYVNHRVPPEFRKAGASNPIKYTFKG